MRFSVAEPRRLFRARVRIPTPTSGSSIRGSSSARTTPRRSTSERPTSVRAPARPSGRSCPTSWTSPTTGPAASWAAPTSPSTRADRAARMRCRPMAGRCGASRPRLGACCSSWQSARFGVPVGQLAVSEGVISVAADPSRKVTYGELIGGKRFNVTLTGNNADATTGVAKLKTVQELKIVGQSPQRYDIPPKVDGSLKWAVDVKLPGMVHARNVKPPVAGATLVSIDESSVRGVPGFVKVVSKGNYVAVVCEREEQAIRAARQLKVNWQKPATAPFPTSDDLLQLHARRDAHVERRAERGRESRRGAGRRGEGDRGRIRCPVPGAHVARSGPCHGRSVERSDDDLFQRHEVVRPAERRRAVSSDAARSRARRLDGGTPGVRPHGRRRCGLRGGVSGEGDRPAGSRAVDEAGGNGLGHEGPGVCGQDARRAGRAGQPRRPRLRRPQPPTTIISDTTSTIPC